MSSVLLQTPRITLRRFVPADIADMRRLDSDPRVLKYINGGRAATQDEVAAAMRRVTRYYDMYPGLGVWRAERRDQRTFIGWYCLKYCPPTCDVEVGYRLLVDAWGQGFATEGARALLDHGFCGLGLARIIGVTHPDNAASQRVLMKAGLHDMGWGRYYDKRLRLFASDQATRRGCGGAANAANQGAP